MQKTRNFPLCFGWLISLFFAPLCHADGADNVSVQNADDNCEIWQACSNDYSLLEFLSDVFAQTDKTESNKDLTNTIQKTEESSSDIFTNH